MLQTPPSAFRWPWCQIPSMSRAPPSPFAELGVHTAPQSHASAGLGAAPLPPPPSRSGHGGIGPRHSLQPPSFFGLSTTTEVDLEVIELVVGVGDDSPPSMPLLLRMGTSYPRLKGVKASLLRSARILPSQWRRKLLPCHLIWLSV